MFIALAIVCDDYFVSSLEKICEVRLFSSANIYNVSLKFVITEQYLPHAKYNTGPCHNLW